MNIDGVDISLDNLGQDLLELLVGQRWPNGDEGAMRSLASVWQDAATRIGQIGTTASAAAQQVGEYCQGANGQTFGSFWSANFDDGQTSWPAGQAPAALPFAVQYCTSMANALNAGADQIETTKDTIMGNIAILVATVAPQIAAGFFDFGATDATALAEVAADRTVMEAILEAAKEAIGEIVEQAITQGLQQAELNFLIQFKEVAEGHASSINLGEVGKTGLAGAAGGAMGAGFGFALGTAGGAVFGEDFGKTFAGKAFTGVASGVLTNAGLDLVENGKISASDFTKGSLAGMLGGMGGAEAASGERPDFANDDLPINVDADGAIAAPELGPTQRADLTQLSGLTPTQTAASVDASADTVGSGTGADPAASGPVTGNGSADFSSALAAPSMITRILGGGDTGGSSPSGYDGSSGGGSSGGGSDTSLSSFSASPVGDDAASSGYGSGTSALMTGGAEDPRGQVVDQYQSSGSGLAPRYGAGSDPGSGSGSGTGSDVGSSSGSGYGAHESQGTATALDGSGGSTVPDRIGSQPDDGYGSEHAAGPGLAGEQPTGTDPSRSTDPAVSPDSAVSRDPAVSREPAVSRDPVDASGSGMAPDSTGAPESVVPRDSDGGPRDGAPGAEAWGPSEPRAADQAGGFGAGASAGDNAEPTRAAPDTALADLSGDDGTEPVGASSGYDAPVSAAVPSAPDGTNGPNGSNAPDGANGPDGARPADVPQPDAVVFDPRAFKSDVSGPDAPRPDAPRANVHGADARSPDAEPVKPDAAGPKDGTGRPDDFTGPGPGPGRGPEAHDEPGAPERDGLGDRVTDPDPEAGPWTPPRELSGELAEVSERAVVSDHGISHFGDPELAELAGKVPPDPDGAFTGDIHGDGTGVFSGFTRMTPEDYLSVLDANGHQPGQPIRLLSCEAGAADDGFAAELSRISGAKVIAADTEVWSDDVGHVFASGSHTDGFGEAAPDIPPNGTWHEFSPDGTKAQVGTDGFPPGQEEGFGNWRAPVGATRSRSEEAGHDGGSASEDSGRRHETGAPEHPPAPSASAGEPGRIPAPAESAITRMEQLEGTEATWANWAEPDRAFDEWARSPVEGPLPPLTRDSKINCWEMVLYAGVSSDPPALTHADVHAIYSFEPDEKGKPPAAWYTGIPDLLAPNGRQEYDVDNPDGPRPGRGDVVFWNGDGHVALATGRLHPDDGSPEVLSFWPPPGEHGLNDHNTWARVDAVKITSIDELYNYMIDPESPGDSYLRNGRVIVEFGAGPW